jgi:hypothetical protein
VYATLNINDDVSQAEKEMRTFLESYYNAPYEKLARHQGLCAGAASSCITWLNEFISAGAQTIVLRFGSSDQFAQLERCVRDVLPQLRTP